MTDLVNPSVNRPADPKQTAETIRRATMERGWIAPYDTSYLADIELMEDAPLNAFELLDHSATSFEVTIDTGEAFVEGAWMARDEQTTVEVEHEGGGVTLYAGWKNNMANQVRIGPSGEFTDSDGYIPIYELDTTQDGVQDYEDVRRVGPALDTNEDGHLAVMNRPLVIESELVMDGVFGGPLTVTRDSYRDHLHLERGDRVSEFSPTNGWSGGMSLFTSFNDSGGGQLKWDFVAYTGQLSGIEHYPALVCNGVVGNTDYDDTELNETRWVPHSKTVRQIHVDSEEPDNFDAGDIWIEVE